MAFKTKQSRTGKSHSHPGATGTPKDAFKKKLAKLSGKWGEAQKEAESMGGGGSLPDGRHIARLTGYQIKPSKKDSLGLNTEWTVVRGESKGEKAYRWDSLEREEGLPYLAKFFRTLGVELEELDLDAIEAAFTKLVEDRVCVRLRAVSREGSEWPNIYIDRIVEDSGEDEEDDTRHEKEETEETDEAEEEGGEPEVDMVVTVEHNGKTKEGTIVKVDAKKQTADVKLPGIKSPVSFKWDAMEPVAEAEEETEGDGEGEVEVEIGSTVLVEHDGKEKEGTVESIDEKAETMMVKLPKLAKAVKFKFDQVAPVLEEAAA